MLFSYSSGVGTYFKMINFNGSGQFNGSYVDDARVKEVHAQVMDLVGVDVEEVEMMRLHGELMPYVLDQAWAIPWPTAYSYYFWPPWRMNYQGEIAVGYYNTYLTAKWTWLDRELKEQITGRR